MNSLSETASAFFEMAHRIVWCSAATVDSKGRPRSRILHPIWEGSTGWIATHPDSHKAGHLAKNPYMSLAYITELFSPVYVDCTAEWIHDLDQKKRIWELFKNTPPP